MKISVILPVSNNEKFAERAIISLLNQTYKNIEILICLNGNTIKYNNIIKKKFRKFKIIKFYEIKTKNIVDALNFLIKKCKGKYIARMDGDDISSPDRFKEQINFLEENKEYFVSTNAEVVNNNLDNIYNHKYKNQKKFFTNPIIHPSIMIKTEILKKIMYRNIPYAEDYDLYLRLEKKGIRLNNLNKNLIFYKLNEKNIRNYKRAFYLFLSTLSLSKAFRESLEVNERYFSLIDYNKSFKDDYNLFLKISGKKLSFLKILNVLRLIFAKNYIIKKLVFSKFLFFLKFKIRNKKKNYEKIIKNKLPFVSIIIPTYNSEKTIIKTLRSILKQTYKNYEIIIVDNSQSSKTINLIKKLKNKKIKIYSIRNHILNSKARNYGVYKASKKSTMIAFCDSDDQWKPNKLKKQIKFMIHEKSSFSFTNYDFFNPKNKTYLKNYFKIPFKRLNFSHLLIKNMIGTSSVILTKKLFHLVGGFPESKYFFSFEDYIFWLKLSKVYSPTYLDDNITIYRDDRKNSATKNSRSFVSQRLRILFYYLFKLDLKSLIIIFLAYIKIFTLTFHKNNKNNEYFDLL